MKILTTLTALTIIFTISCTSGNNKNEHGHEHDDSENSHQHLEKEESPINEQEEFIVKEDSVKSKLDDQGHSHDKGHNHTH